MSCASFAQFVDGIVWNFVRKPEMCVTIGIISILTTATVSIYPLGMMDIETQNAAWTAWSKQATQDHISYQRAEDMVDPLGNFSRHFDDSDSGEEDSVFHVFYKTNKQETGTMFSAENIRDICMFERLLLDTHGGELVVWDSIVKMLYHLPSQEALACELLDSAQLNSFVAMVAASVKDAGPKSPYAPFVHPSFVDTGLSPLIRTTFVVRGAAIEEWEQAWFDRLGLSYRMFHSAYTGDEDRFSQLGGESGSSLRVRLFFLPSAEAEFQRMVPGDFNAAAGSILLVYIIMWAYLRSFWMASFGMLQIICSLPVGALLYRGVFRIEYFEFLHVLIVYLVLGIGADDILVLVDTVENVAQRELPAFQLNGEAPFDAVAWFKPMRTAYMESASAIFSTSFTTGVAFLSCSVSKVMPMRSCGWFAAICILVNWFFTIAFTPACLMVYKKHFAHRGCCGVCCGAPQVSPLEEKNSDPKPRLKNSKEIDPPPQKTEVASNMPLQTPPPLHPSSPPTNNVKKNQTSRLVRSYIGLMEWQLEPWGIKPVALGVALALLATTVQGLFYTFQLTPPRKPEQWFPGGHMFVDVSEFWAGNFYSPDYDRYAVVSLFWGIDSLDMTGFSEYDPEDDSSLKPIFAPQFDLSNAEAQEELLLTCAWLRTLQCELAGCDNKPADGYDTFAMQSQLRTHTCFLEDMRQSLNGSLPIGPAFLPALIRFRTEASQSDLGTNSTIKDDYKGRIGIVGGELRYVSVAIRSTMAEDMPFGKGIAVRNMMREFVRKRAAASPNSMKSLKMHANGVFERYDLGEELIDSFFSGCIIALPVAFLVLLFSTWNIVVATYAIGCVASIVVCVLGFCRSAMDWDLGTAEAIAGVIVIGYSVDYVVHLAHFYCAAGAHRNLVTREDRTRFAAENMGSTIVAGAVTTAAAGLTMIVCFLQFFFKMAVLITVTIGFSFLYSLGLFMALLWLFGPEGDFGNLPTLRRESKKISPSENVPCAVTANEGD